MAIRTATRSATLARSGTTDPPVNDALTEVLALARLQVLRCTVIIALLIALGNVVGSIAGFTPSRHVAGPAIVLSAAWSVLWAMAAIFPRLTARCFENWVVTALALATANAATVALTGGIDSPVLAVCMYVGWIASVVTHARPVVLTSSLIAVSLLAGYFLSGASLNDILDEEYRYAALTSAALPIVTGLVGLLLASVTNRVFSRLPETIHGLRGGADATTPPMTALFAGQSVVRLPSAGPTADRAAAGARLTDAERDVVALLARGHRPKQIALLRNVAISTIRSQIKAAKSKTGARTIEELIAVAWDGGA